MPPRMRTPLPCARSAVIGRAARHGVHQIFAAERLHRRQAFFGEPGVEHVEDALAHELRMQHAAVEQDVRRAGEAARSAPHVSCSAVTPAAAGTAPGAA